MYQDLLLHRSSQHISDHKRTVSKKGRSSQTQDPSPSSWIADHAEESHGGLTGLDPEKDIKFIKGKTHRDPLSRLIEEATLINWGLERGLEIGASKDPESIVCLNRKEEMFAPRVRFK